MRFVFLISLSRRGYEVVHKEKPKKTQREAARERRQRDLFRPSETPTDPPTPVPQSPPGSPNASADLQYEDVLDMVHKLNNKLGLITLDNDKIRSVCNQLLKDNKARDRVIGDLTGLVERSLDRPAVHRPQHNNNNNNITLVIAPHILVASSRALYIITLTSTCFIPTHTSTPRGAYSTCSHI